MNAFVGQCYEQNMTHYLYADVGFADDGDTVSLGRMPADGIILRVTVTTTTAFDAGTTNQIDVGYRDRGDGVGDDPDGLASNVNVAAAGVDSVDLSSTANLGFPEGGELTASIDLVGSAATAGAARVVVEYTVPNNEP